MSVIYAIINNVTEKSYIGSSENFNSRYLTHLRTLRNNTHHNIHLQRSFNKYGEESFEFIILEECSKEAQFTLEEEYITSCEPELLYNIGSVGGGDNLTNHPNKEEIIRKRTETQKATIANMSEQERKDRFGMSKDDNPNWQGGKTYCKCGARKKGSAKTCMSCRNRVGSNNPFYGKKHSDETKKKLSVSLKGQEGRNFKVVSCEGVVYQKIKCAAEFYGISPGAMTYRLRSSADRWEDFFYV